MKFGQRTGTVISTQKCNDLPLFTASSQHQLFDVPKVRALKQHYEEVLEFISSDYPINLNSTHAILEYVNKVLNIPAQNTTIRHLDSFLMDLPSDGEVYSRLYGIIAYLKLKYGVKNYLDCILRHEQNGAVELRWHNKQWCMPNKQPLTKNPEILDCMRQSN